jgi:hypothetical protein
MDDQQFHREQLLQFHRFAGRLESNAAEPGGEALRPLAEAFAAVAATPDTLYDDAPALVARLFTVAPGYAQDFPRDLLWYLGADCLHFMPDEEIEQFNALDEDRRSAADRGLRFDWSGAVASSRTLQ